MLSRKQKSVLSAILVMSMTTQVSACQQGKDNSIDSQIIQLKEQPSENLATSNSTDADIPAITLTEAERNSILWMREEEKLAYDVYRTLYDKWQIRAFDNISNSELRHMNAMKILIEKYELTDPVDTSPIGVFKDQKLQRLYDNLVARGKQSRLEAVKVGAEIEELDIADLREGLSQINNPDITQVYENLLRGSRNHLRAFNRQVVNMGGSYKAKHISQTDYDAIATSENERGHGGAGKGGGQGMKRGMGMQQM